MKKEEEFIFYKFLFSFYKKIDKDKSNKILLNINSKFFGLLAMTIIRLLLRALP